MRVRIEIELENDSFVQAGVEEIENVLEGAMKKIRQFGISEEWDRELNLLDVNGNRCGIVKVEE